MPVQLWQSAGVALALGLLVGAERERSGVAVAGVRTFALASLVGFVATQLPAALGALLLSGLVLLVVVGYVVAPGTDRGLTSEVALVVTAGLGALTASEPAVAVAVAVVMVVLLAGKEAIHRFLRESMTEQERVDALTFFVAALVVLPLLPSRGFGPAHALSLHRVWLLVVLITGVGWLGGLLTRMLGARRGLLVSGLAGGFVSATATIGAIAGQVRRGAVGSRAGLAGTVMASVATLVQLAVLTTAVDRAVAARLYPGVGVGVVVFLGEVWLLGRGSPPRAETADSAPVAAETARSGRPFGLVPAVVLALVISLVVVLATWTQERYGAAGVWVVAATGGLADAHATSVAIAGLAHGHQVGVTAAVLGIALALATNTAGKIIAATVTGGPAFAAKVVALHLPAAVAFGALLVVG